MKKFNQSEIEMLVAKVVKTSNGNITPDELKDLCVKEIYSNYKATKKVVSYINYNLTRDIMRNITMEHFMTGNF